jgi:hypothetical protein
MNFVILSHLYSEITSGFRQILYYEHTRNQGKEILASYGVRIQRESLLTTQWKLLLLQNN